MSPKERDFVSKYIEDGIKLKILRPSLDGQWASPLHLVPKGDT